MNRSVMGGKLLGLTLLLSLSLVACVGDDTDVEESTEDAVEELIAGEVGAPKLGEPAPIEEFDSLDADIKESAPLSIPGADRLEPEPIPWIPTKPNDPNPKSAPAPLPT